MHLLVFCTKDQIHGFEVVEVLQFDCQTTSHS